MARQGTIRVGLIADTHEASDPVALIKTLQQKECDLYVHLGDIGGSRLTSKIVHEYKQTLGNLDHLSPAERARFDELRKKGLSPIWSYIEMRIGDDPSLQAQRLRETGESYAQVISEMSQLRRPFYLLAGNVDRALAAIETVRSAFEQYAITLTVHPDVLDFGEQAIILWPSMKTQTAEASQHLQTFVDRLAPALHCKRRIIVLAHEQLFKGPPPARYTANVARAGYRALTVPYFEPNPTWPYLLKLFRALPATVDLVFVHGHVHDPSSVISAGAPYLKGSGETGLAYRVFGLGSTRPCSAVRGGRRIVRIFCVPAGEAMVLVLDDRMVRLTSAGSVQSWTRS